MVRQVNKGLLKPYQSAISFGQKMIDPVLIAGALLLISTLLDVRWDAHYSFASLLSCVTFFFVASHNNIYESWRAQSLKGELGTLLRTWTTSVAILLIVGFLSKTTDHFSRKSIILWLAASPILLVSLRVSVRLFLRQLRAKGRNTRSIAIAGAGPLGVTLAHSIMTTPWMGITVAGLYDDKIGASIKHVGGFDMKVVGSLKKLEFDARNGRYDEVYIALPMSAEDRIKDLIRSLSDSSVQVQYVPDIFTLNLINSRIKDIGGIPVIGVYDSPLDGLGRFIKRFEDIVIGGSILLLIAIPMILISIAIKLDSPGPLLFKQRRYGLSGEKIPVWKFRTMSVCEDGEHIQQATKKDQRITKVGRFLRQTSLDELPQFINVLQGNMSIVGPRPHAVAHNELYRNEIDGYMQRHLVKPGITGWAQVNGWRGETDTLEKMEKRVEHDLHYIENWSLWLDIKIIFMTIFKGFINKNAY